jgi:hypothetical protein
MQRKVGNLSPARMMRLPELLAATKLVRKAHTLQEKWRESSWGKDLPPARQLAISTQRDHVDAELGALATAVLARQLGVKKYMVIHARRDDGYEDRFQVLSVSVRLTDTYEGRRWMWNLEGRRLRKDGTLGESPGGMGIDAGSVHRRMLDGSWVELRPRHTTAGP